MAKRGLGKGLGAFFGEEVTTTKENAAEKVSRSERKDFFDYLLEGLFF